MNVKMEVNDIESFFMNKDKKKKSKKITTINPASLLEKTKETENKKSKKVTDKQQQSQEPQSDLLRKTKEDEDWEDACVQEVDLASLRIGKMPAKVEDKVKVEVPEENGSDDDDGCQEKVDRQAAHPWGSGARSLAAREASEGDTAGAVAAAEEHVESGQPKRYVVPSMRGGPVLPGSRAAKKAPNISNSVDFPSLREAVDLETEDSSWSRVSKGGHCEKPAPQVSATTTAKNNYPIVDRTTGGGQPIKKEFNQNITTTVDTKPAQPSKYIPPHLRKAQSKPTENRFNNLKEESLN